MYLSCIILKPAAAHFGNQATGDQSLFPIFLFASGFSPTVGSQTSSTITAFQRVEPADQAGIVGKIG